MGDDLNKSCPIKSEIIVEETFSFCENYEDWGKEELKLEPVDIKIDTDEDPLKCKEEDNLTLQECQVNGLLTQNYGYSCDKCDFKAVERFSLSLHSKMHKNHYYSCKECNFITSWKHYLKKHSKRHENDKEKNNKHNCKKCDFKTQWTTCLREHLKIHKNDYYSCKKCNFKTRWDKCLKRHSKVHAEDRPYKCTECNNMFKRKDNLKRHIFKIHHLNKPRKKMHADEV
ncbi:hypothetical protein FQA39_LY17994 [Lamprigera yunnana]|nr:hypothetical protein FQA39_LY17994 [Lamprigera yunnana]